VGAPAEQKEAKTAWALGALGRIRIVWSEEKAVAYVECPECGLRLNTGVGFVSESCPRCRGREGKRVWLEAKLGALRGGKRFERTRKVAEADLTEAGLGPTD
jgi:hypothetical protein